MSLYFHRLGKLPFLLLCLWGPLGLVVTFATFYSGSLPYGSLFKHCIIREAFCIQSGFTLSLFPSTVNLYLPVLRHSWHLPVSKTVFLLRLLIVCFLHLTIKLHESSDVCVCSVLVTSGRSS